MLTEPVTCSSCKAVSVNGGVLHCHSCYTALEGELTEAGYKIDDMASDVDIRNDRIKEKDGEIERLIDTIADVAHEYEYLRTGRGGYVLAVNDLAESVKKYALRSGFLKQKVEELEKRNQELREYYRALAMVSKKQQALIDQMREAIKNVKNWQAHFYLPTESIAKDYLEKLYALASEQACTKGEPISKDTEEYGDSIGCNEVGEKQYMQRLKKPCPDCYGDKKVNTIYYPYPQVIAVDCPTCKDSTGEVTHEHKFERVDGLLLCECGTPFAPPRPKGDNPHG